MVDWLHARGISDEVIKFSQIHYDVERDEIAIPIFDKHGTFLFNKYRRAPWNTEGPKYRYESGSTAQLYNASYLELEATKNVIIAEGELDCLLLLSRGFNAVSSTGGSGTFLPEWASLFSGKNVFICYDTDDAGIKGTYKVQGILPDAKVIWLPKGKDVTEFFLTAEFPNTTFENLLYSARSYTAPKDIDWNAKRTPIKDVIRANEQASDFILHSIDMAKQEGRPFHPLEILLAHYVERNEADRQRYKYVAARLQNGGSKISEAKKVPITQFLEFPYTKTICCIWHEETTPSMHYYDHQNVVKCFGCDKRGDVIDVVMQLRKVGLPEAVNIILGVNNQNG